MQNQYSYTSCDSSRSYHFTTKYDIEYSITFIEDGTINSILSEDEQIENVYQVVVEKISDKSGPFDLAVSKTVSHIIFTFLSKLNNTLLFICSPEDDKAKIRFDTFGRWYTNSDFKSVIIKKDNVISSDNESSEHTLYTSLLYHRNNPNKSKIIGAYQQLEAVLNQEK